jgi:hypothetical protein
VTAATPLRKSGTRPPAVTERPRAWDFQVMLDGQPIGRHRFELSGDGEHRALLSRAAFDVRLLGIPVYRYRHEVREQWRGDCLASLQAETVDDGDRSAVHAVAEANGLRIDAATGTVTESGCVMSYAYWHPAMLRQSRLLNPQTGVVDTVRITSAGTGTIEVESQQRPATRWVIDNPAGPVTVWISPQGDWVGLDATVRGTRTLSYRLR